MTKVTSNTRTRKEHLFAEERIYHINYGVLQGFPALRKAVTTNVKKYNIFWRVFDIANQLLNVTRLYSVRLINERQSLHHSLSKIVCWNVFGLWLKNTRITLSLTDSDVRTFLEGEEEKPKVTHSVALVLSFLAAENENRQLEDFCCVPWRFLLSVRTNCRNTLYHYIFFLFWSHAPRKKISWDTYHLSLGGGGWGEVGGFWLCRDKMTWSPLKKKTNKKQKKTGHLARNYETKNTFLRLHSLCDGFKDPPRDWFIKRDAQGEY